MSHRARFFIAAAAVATIGVANRSALAQWIYPPFETLGVSAKGDTYLQYGVATTVFPHTQLGNGTKPKILWPTGGTDYSTVALEFPWVEPADICVVPDWVNLTIPLAVPFTPSSDVELELRTYWEGADGVVDASNLATRQNGPFMEDLFDTCVSGPGCADADGDGRNDIVDTLTLTAGVTVTSLDFVVRWNYRSDRWNQGAGPFKGFFVDRADSAQDAQVITLENGGAVIEFGGYGGCPPSNAWAGAATCFQDFGNGNWVAVEFINAYYDGDLGGYLVDGILIPSDPISGADGCTITQYPAGPVSGVTDFYPATTGAIQAAYDIDLSGFPAPVGTTNPIVVTIGYQGYPQEQDKEQQMLLYHAPNGINAVDVTHEYRSNRKGNLDGGVLQSIQRTSASPFILAFAADVADCGAISAGELAPPMGSTRRLGSKLPLKLSLSLGDAALDSLEALEAAGLTSPNVRIYDVTAGGMTLVTERGLRDAGAKWSEEVDLAPGLFAPARTYEVRLQVGSCELVPSNAHFQTR